MRNVYLATFFAVLLLVTVLGFRGGTFTHTPMDVFPEWLFPGMKYQPKLRPQAASSFFADGRADRLPPPHTVARDALDTDDAMYRGRDPQGQFLRGFPAGITVDMKLLQRGQERFTIYCSPCHGLDGAGDGMLSKYGMSTLPSNGNYHSERIRNMPEGQIFDTITHGSASKIMMPYADKLTPHDRWAVVAYVRALERAREGTVADVTDPAAKQTLGIK